MLKTVLAFAITLFSFNAFSATPFDVLAQTQQNLIQKSNRIGWVVGDTANYSVDMGFIKGSMVMSVASIGTDGVWLVQDMDLGFAGKQKIESLLDPNTGEIKKMIVNGKEEQVPEKPQLEVIEIVDETITVPAGTFACTHARLSDKSNGDELNMWASQAVPLSGLVKQLAPSQFGQVTILLTSFHQQ